MKYKITVIVPQLLQTTLDVEAESEEQAVAAVHRRVETDTTLDWSPLTVETDDIEISDIQVVQ